MLRANALELILLGRRLDAEEALAIGLIHRITPEGPSVLDDTLDMDGALPITEGIAFERAQYEACLVSEDRREALRAFAEKRKPEFRGQ